MGVDSLMALDFKTLLETNLNCSLPGTLLFEVPNIQELATYLGEKILNWSLPDNEIDHQEIETESSLNISEIEQLSSEEIAASIAAKLSQLESLVGFGLN